MPHPRAFAACFAATFLFVLPVAQAEEHNDTTRVTTNDSTSDLVIDDLTTYHCVYYHRHHCNGTALLTSSNGSASASASAGKANDDGAWHVADDGAVSVDLSYDASGAAASPATFVLAIEHASGIVFRPPLDLTIELDPGERVTRTFDFTLAPDAPEGDWLFPRLALGLPAEDAWTETWLPIVVARAPEESTQTPLGAAGALAALAVAAIALAAARRRG